MREAGAPESNHPNKDEINEDMRVGRIVRPEITVSLLFAKMD